MYWDKLLPLGYVISQIIRLLLTSKHILIMNENQENNTNNSNTDSNNNYINDHMETDNNNNNDNKESDDNHKEQLNKFKTHDATL